MKKLILLSILFIVGCEELTLNNNKISDCTAVTDTLYVIDTLIVADIDTNIIHLDFALIKIISSQPSTSEVVINCNHQMQMCEQTCSGYNTTPLTGGDPCIDCSGICMGTTSQDECDLCSSDQYDCYGTCNGDLEYDCNCDCGGSVIKEVYYYDYDGDGLGGEHSTSLCPDNIPSDENLVLNDDDDDDNIYACHAFYSFDTSNFGMMLYDDRLEFQFLDNNYSVDIISCDTTIVHQTRHMIHLKEIGFIQITNLEEDGTFETFNFPCTDDFGAELLFTIP